ncbi:hypothetical protein [Streptomyces tubercidicus]
MSSNIQRFYLDWGIHPGEEVTHEEALDEGDYTRAQFNESGTPLFAAFYDSGRLSTLTTGRAIQTASGMITCCIIRASPSESS